jgi:hypothetical protein
MNVEIESDDLDDVHDFLLEADVVDQPSGPRDVVAELWLRCFAR